MNANNTLKKFLFVSIFTLINSGPLLAAPQITLYAPNWSEYSDANNTYKAYEYDGAYQNRQPYGTLKYVKNTEMVAQFNNANVLAWSFMQVWNVRDPNQTEYNIPAAWDGVMHFSDIWGELPFEASWVKPLPPETADFLSFCKNIGDGACAAVQVNGNTGQKELFKYTEQKGVGQLNSFGAFINSNKYKNNVKRIIAIGGANTKSNKAISTMTYDAIFANQNKFLVQYKQWMDHFKNLKGVDYDFEPPIDIQTGAQLAPDSRTTSDYQKLFSLVKSTREKLGADAYISVTITSNLNYLKFINESVKGGWFKQIAPFVDSVNLMTYDFHGPWDKSADPVTSVHAYLKQPNTAHSDDFSINYAAEKVTEQVLAYGMPANKIQIGIAAYGRGFANVPAGNDPSLPGFEQTWSGGSHFANRYSLQEGMLPYKTLYKVIDELGYQSYDVTALDQNKNSFVTGSYIYNGKANQFVGYQSPKEVAEICKYIKAKGLKGAILWSADTDLPVSDQRSLLATYRKNCG